MAQGQGLWLWLKTQLNVKVIIPKVNQRLLTSQYTWPPPPIEFMQPVHTFSLMLLGAGDRWR